jgi:hypothetical protein
MFLGRKRIKLFYLFCSLVLSLEDPMMLIEVEGIQLVRSFLNSLKKSYKRFTGAKKDFFSG